MKFYYNGQLIRTSKTHHYTHACIEQLENGKIGCIGCSGTRQGAEKIKQKAISDIKREINSHIAQLEAINSGKNHYIINGRSIPLSSLPSFYTKENVERYLKDSEEYLKKIENNWMIVELTEI